MIVTWLTDEEMKAYSSVDDKELDELFQEIRQLYPDKFFIQTIPYDNRNWFERWTGDYRKNIGKVYSLYIKHNGQFDVQCFNFPPLEGTWSINTCAPKAMLMTFFFGLLAVLNYTSTV